MIIQKINSAYCAVMKVNVKGWEKERYIGQAQTFAEAINNAISGYIMATIPF